MLILLTLLFSLFASDAVAADYPPTRRVDQVDNYHGTEVADPYRWLEADVRESEEVADWVEQQSLFARTYLDAIPARKLFADRLAKLYDYERFSPPSKKGKHYFFYRNDGLQDQSVLYVSDSPTGKGRILIDPNTWSEDGTIALAGYSVSDDGKRIAIAQSSSGSDWRTIHVMEVESGKIYSDAIEWVRFGGASWDHQGHGFYYARYPQPKKGEKFQAAAMNQKLYYHRLGDSQDKDQVIYERPDQPSWTFPLDVTKDGEMLVLSISSSTDTQNQVWLYDLTNPKAEWEPLIDNFDHEYGFIAKVGERLFFLTDEGAPRKRVVAINLADRKSLGEIVPESDATLVDVDLVGRMPVSAVPA